MKIVRELVVQSTSLSPNGTESIGMQAHDKAGPDAMGYGNFAQLALTKEEIGDLRPGQIIRVTVESV